MKLGLKNTLATETFGTDSDDVSVREHVDLTTRTFRSRFERCVEAKNNVTKFLVDITIDLPLCGGRG